MDKRAKLLGIPRSLISSLTSCRTQNLLSDVIRRQSNAGPSPPDIPFSGSTCSEPLLPPPPHHHSSRKKLCGRTKSQRWRSSMSSSLEDDSDWFSSDDEREDDPRRPRRETEALFSSSRSFLSVSSEGSRRRRPPCARRRRKRQEQVKGTFAVVKRSSDPYADFRASMVEMIVEKRMFGASQLEQLLDCFLSLNPTTHHRLILEVFAEICDALFSNFSSPVHRTVL